MKKNPWIILFGLFLLIPQLIFAATPTPTPWELVVNGDFSAPVTPGIGIPGWQAVATPVNYAPVTATTVSDGFGTPDLYQAYYTEAPGCFIGNNTMLGMSDIKSYLIQSITIPDATAATLTAWFRWIGQPYWGTNEYARITFGGQVLMTRMGTDIEDPYFVQLVYDLPRNPITGVVTSKGQTLDLIFQATDDSSSDKNFLLVDDVSILVFGVATVTQTSTSSPTSTPSPTRTSTPTITFTRTITPTSTMTVTRTITPTVTPYFVDYGKLTAYPNPANGNQVVFMYSINNAVDKVTVEVYNLAGMRAAVLTDGAKPAAINHKTTWNITGVAPGIYLYRLVLEADNGFKSQSEFYKLVITK